MSNATADRTRRSLVRRAAVSVAGAAALAGVTGVYAPGVASAQSQAAADFGDCPALPAGVDPGKWRCEVHTAAPKLTIGKVSVVLAPITMTHAEGPMADGTDGQVW